jgi:hypothetical protein
MQNRVSTSSGSLASSIVRPTVLEDFEARDALNRSVNFILGQLGGLGFEAATRDGRSAACSLNRKGSGVL